MFPGATIFKLSDEERSELSDAVGKAFDRTSWLLSLEREHGDKPALRRSRQRVRGDLLAAVERAIGPCYVIESLSGE